MIWGYGYVGWYKKVWYFTVTLSFAVTVFALLNYDKQKGKDCLPIFTPALFSLKCTFFMGLSYWIKQTETDTICEQERANWSQIDNFPKSFQQIMVLVFLFFSSIYWYNSFFIE